tara:strand:+ start:10956 stop:12098 length:1143 start_codon:yes stop_codon:yes gene_type:complete
MNKLSNALAARFIDQVEFSPREVTVIARELGISDGAAYKYTTDFPKVSRGVYNLESVVVPLRKSPPAAMVSSTVTSIMNEEVFVPAKDSCYIQWGHSKDVEMIINSGAFYPTYVTGLSGNGKTMMIEQACARLGREYVRVQITPETDEDDLIGGFRLVNGETVFNKGPVIKAMEQGAVLLIDELDRGSNKIMCLQGVLEGKPILIKKTGEVVKPAHGFNVLATANTKGQGDDNGRFIAATILDEAFLERFTITLEQPYPSASVENKILAKHMIKYGVEAPEFTTLLTAWSDTIRKTYEDGGIDEVISTRRLCHIVQTYSIFKDCAKAVKLCVSRFDADTQDAFLDLYDKMVPQTPEAAVTDTSIDDVLNAALYGAQVNDR